MDQTSIQIIKNALSKYVTTHKEGSVAIREFLKDTPDCTLSERTLRRYVQNITKERVTYEDHINNLNINENDIKSVKSWQTVNGDNRYSLVFKKEVNNSWAKEVIDYFDTKANPTLHYCNTKSKIGVVKTADWHIGAYIRNLVVTQNYDFSILEGYLANIAGIINSHNYSEVHISINGDLIESFSGLNHMGTFKELELWGASAITTAYEVICRWILGISNVKSLTIISGNHDRTSIGKELDYEGDAAGIIAYFLREKLSIQVNYHPFVFSQIIDGINYIDVHADKSFVNNIAKVAWDYGDKSVFNLIIGAHLHTRKKITNRVNNLTKDILNDSKDFRMIYSPSLFTGNFFSETHGFSSTAGFYIVENFNGLPYIHDIPLK